MKRILTAALCILLLSGCHSAAEPQKLPEEPYVWSYDEIYVNGKYTDTFTDPAKDRMNLYPYGNTVYAFWDDWHYASRDDEGIIRSYNLCADPMCSHSGLPCISYALSASQELYIYDNTIYSFAYGDDMVGKKLIAYSLDDGKSKTIAEADLGGLMITQLGRFLYYYTLRDEGAEANGKVNYAKEVYRYDVETGGSVLLGEYLNSWSMTQAYGYEGEIYYLNSQQILTRCDANFKNHQPVGISDRLTTYQLCGDTIFYLTQTGEDTGDLYALDIESGEKKHLYSEVTWFCCSGDDLYYSLYNPVDAFEWDYPMDGIRADRNHELTRVMITVKNGNTIYRVSEDKTEKLRVTSASLGEVYCAIDGVLYIQLKEPYRPENTDVWGMKTGCAAVIFGESGTEESITYITEQNIVY